MATGGGDGAEDCDLKCLSIQSHVVDGYVGNKAAVFPLCLHGFDVSPVNSVQFSNHTGYGKWKGTVLEGDQLRDLVDGMDSNGLLSFSHLLTGYMRSASFVAAVRDVLLRLRERNPRLVYVCDPVMGDNGKLYVPEELVPIYRDDIVPLASMLTPNQFEAELLTGKPARTVAESFAACDALHSKGVGTVVITSSETHTSSGEEKAGDAEAGADGASSAGSPCVTLMASTSWERVAASSLFAGTAAAADGTGGESSGTGVAGARPSYARFYIDIPKLPGTFTGTGDLTSALLLAWSNRLPDDFVGAVERTVASVQAVLRRTIEHGHKSRELRLVQSKRDLEDPAVVLKARAWVAA